MVRKEVSALAEALPYTRHLRTFQEVCRAGSVSGASHVLRRAQSAVTRAVLQLETALRVPLFERSVRGMLPTEYGHKLHERVQRAYAHMEAARREIAPLRTRERHAEIYTLHMTERRLRTVLELARRQHMGAVADALAMSQPAVSQVVREIETSVGAALFERGARGLRPTPAGETLARQLQLALNEIRIAVDEIAAMQGLKQGEVRVGTLSLGRTYLLPVAVTRLLARHPALRISTMEAPFAALAAALRAGEIDFILGALRPPQHCLGLLREPYLEDTMSVIVRAGHPLCERRRIALRELMSASWVLPQPETPTRTLFEAALAAHGLQAPQVALETAELSIIREVLLESDMLTAISPHQFHREIRAGMLAELPVALPETRRQIGILRRADDRPSPGAQLLLQELKAITAIPGAERPSAPRPRKNQASRRSRARPRLTPEGISAP